MGGRTASRTKKVKHSGVFDQVNYNAAGIDAGAEFHYVAVPEDRASPSVRKFPTVTRGLYELADWLAEAGIDTVAVEATGVYCIPLLEVLDARGFKVVLAKPSSLKSVNDRRKTDTVDCQWIQMLHAFGLLRGSVRPTKMVATFRSYNRQRRMLIEHASSSIEHIKKALTQMNVRIDLAVTDVTGKTGMGIIRAILKGERDPSVLASMRDERCAKNEAAIADALFGKYSDEHLFALEQAVRTWDHYQVLIAECNEQLEKQAGTFEKKADRKDMPKPRRVEHVRKNVLTFDARSLFFEVLGQDLTQIDGISTGTVSAFLAEVGTNLDDFETVKDFTSWLRVSPGSNTTGGKNRSGKNRPTTNRLTTALRVAAQTLSRSRSALGAYYRRKRGQFGPEKANKAAAHKLARMIYFTLKYERPYVDPGPDHYTQKHRERIIKSMEKRAKQLGYQLVKAA
jgi:Transposase IS116/IS110/IS902 family./Transposase.